MAFHKSNDKNLERTNNMTLPSMSNSIKQFWPPSYYNITTQRGNSLVLKMASFIFTEFFFQFFKNFNIYLPMYKLSCFQFFSDFPPKNRAKFNHFSLFFEFHPSLFMHFSDAEIAIVLWWQIIYCSISISVEIYRLRTKIR